MMRVANFAFLCWFLCFGVLCGLAIETSLADTSMTADVLVDMPISALEEVRINR